MRSSASCRSTDARTCSGLCWPYIEFGLSKRNTYDLMHSPVIDKTQFPELLNSAVGAFEELVCVLAELNPGISAKDLDIKCIHYWALVHGLVGLLRNDSLAAFFFK